MRAIFIAVGSELLERDRIDTNSLYVAKKLREKGILIDMKISVCDNLENLSWIVKNAYKRAQLLIITGGLGPTEDDLTRESVANALKKDLLFKESIVDEIRETFLKRGIRRMPEINKRQAFVIEGAEVLTNNIGTAPGLYIDDEICKVLLLPGPPIEMIPMFDKVFEEKIAPLSNFFIYTKSLKFSGITESETDSKIAEIYAKYKNPRTTILAAPGLIEVHLIGRSKKSIDEAQTLTDELAEKIKERMKDYILTEKDISFEELIVNELGSRQITLSVAESCTGGALGNRITNVPGSSEIFLGGIIAYSNELKAKMLEVKEETLKKYGAVSKETAKEMAQGIRKKSGSDIGISITGIAGPGGATKGKPVGLVFMHLNSEKEDRGIYKIFPNNRNIVKTGAVNYSLNLIKKYLDDK